MFSQKLETKIKINNGNKVQDGILILPTSYGTNTIPILIILLIMRENTLTLVEEIGFTFILAKDQLIVPPRVNFKIFYFF